MASDAADIVSFAIARALRGEAARVTNPVAAALLGATGIQYLGPLTIHSGSDTAQDGEVRWTQHINFTDIKLEVCKDGSDVIVRIDGPNAIDRAIRDAIEQVAAEVTPVLKNAIRRATLDCRDTYVNHPFASMLLGALGDQYLGPTQPSSTTDYPIGPEAKWIQLIGDTGLRVEVIMLDNELLVRPVD